MTHDQVKNLLNDFFDESLPAETSRTIELHLSECSDCSQYLFSLQDLMKHAEKLPRKVKPKTDFWNDIFNVISNIKAETIKQKEEIDSIEAERILKKEKAQKKWKKKEKAEKETKRVSLSEKFNKPIFRYSLLGIAALIVLYLGYNFLFAKGQAWQINNINIANGNMGFFGELSEDKTVETKDINRLEIKIPDIGEILIEPNSKIQRLSSNSILLTKGQISVIKTSAKEFFNVQVPEANIKDFFLGGRYKLSLLDRTVKLEVIDGWVSMKDKNTESIVLPNHICEFKIDSGMGLPYINSSSIKFIDAINNYCFSNPGNEESLISILCNAEASNAVTLWNLMFRTNMKQREIVIFTMFNLVGQPLDVTDIGLKRLQKDMVQKFLEYIEPLI